MKKTVLLVIVVLCGLTFAGKSQNTFKKGDKVLNLGIGLGNAMYTGSWYTSKIPPLSASFEMCLKDNLFNEKSSLGLGGYFGYTSAKYEYSGWGTTYGYKYTDIIIGARGVFHYQLIDKFDTYAGVLLGYDIVNAKEIGDAPSTYNATESSARLDLFVGARYYFTERFAAMAEVGYGIAYLNLGVAVKF